MLQFNVFHSILHPKACFFFVKILCFDFVGLKKDKERADLLAFLEDHQEKLDKNSTKKINISRVCSELYVFSIDFYVFDHGAIFVKQGKRANLGQSSQPCGTNS